MSKRASTTMRAVAKPVNFPDVLGAITNGKRLVLGVLHMVVASRPPAINAGTSFDAIVLLQNTASADVDVVIRLSVPDVDAAGQKGCFMSALDHPVRVSMRPGEVGYANLPVQVAPETLPGQSYAVLLEIQVEPKSATTARVRDESGGAPFSLAELPEKRRSEISGVQDLNYSVVVISSTGSKVTLMAPFEVLPASVTSLPLDLTPAYTTLWTMSDYSDESALVAMSQTTAAALLPQLNRTTMFFPLLKATQAHYEKAGYRLWAGEAILIAKLLTYILEMGPTVASDSQALPTYRRWYFKLCSLLLQNPERGATLDTSIGDLLYPDLIYDATLYGFASLMSATGENFGSQDDMTAYANALVVSLTGEGQPLDLVHTYIPLVLAGLVANLDLPLPHEQPRETINLLRTALHKRANEQTVPNKFIFDLSTSLIMRTIDSR